MPENLSLKAARKRRHWTQTQAAQKCGVDLQTYYRWENGIQEPQPYNIDRLCEIFQQPMEHLGYAHLIEVTEEEVTAPAEGSELIRLTPQQITALLPFIGDSTMDQRKRTTLQTMFATAAGLLIAPSLIHIESWERLATGKSSNINEQSLQHLRDLMQTCWKLSNTGELDLAENILTQFLPRLESMAPHLPEAANLTAQGLQLKSILVAHNLKLADKVALCQRSVSYVRDASDVNVLVAGLAQLAIAYQYADQFKDALATYQEALKYSHQVSPLLQSRIYIEGAAMFAKSGRKKEARFYMSLAEETYPTSPQDDPSFLFADSSLAIIALHTGLAYTYMGQPTDALNSLHYQTLKEIVPERIRLEIVNSQGQAAILLGDLDQYTATLQDGLAGARALGSKKRYNEAVSIFQNVPATWRKEPQLRPIIEQYSL
jgi:transcriptional regulator with XRE-family HTH domain